MALLKELFTGELISRFSLQGTFLERLTTANNYVNNNVIHLVDVGTDPDVLIDNTTYPLTGATRTDTDVTVSLNKFQSTPTFITDDELYALPYDKISSVTEQHRRVLEEKVLTRSAFDLAPSANTAETPLVLTTGVSDGLTNARKRITMEDIIRAKRKLDDLNVPREGRILVLCSKHAEELLGIKEAFAVQYQNIQAGSVLPRLYGFEVHEFNANPLYRVQSSTLQKLAFGSATDATKDQEASLFFYAPRAFRARGEVKMYHREPDPQYQRTEVSFKLYHKAMPKNWTGFGAIVSSLTA